MARPAPLIELPPEQRTWLEGFARSRETAHSLVQRAQMILRAADGEPSKQIAQALGVNEDCVGQWRRRWADAHDTLATLTGQPKRLHTAIEEVLSDRPRSGSPGDFTPEQICQIIALACETPPAPLTHWTRQDLKRESIKRGIVETISASTIGRFLKSGPPQTPSYPLLAESHVHGRSDLSPGRARGLQTVSSGDGVARTGGSSHLHG